MEERGGEKVVVVRMKRKHDQDPLEAFWLEIKERPSKKRPSLLHHFDHLSLSSSSCAPHPHPEKVKKVLVKHVETVASSEASLPLLHSLLQPSGVSGDSRSKQIRPSLKASLPKQEQLLDKAKLDQQELAKTARFEQVWKRRTRDPDSVQDDSLAQLCRVYDVLRVDADHTSTQADKQPDMSVEDREMLSKFLPLLRDCIPDAAEEIESHCSCPPSQQGPTDGYVYDLYTVQENSDEAKAAYPFPLVQVDDDDQFYDGPDDSDYETDDSNAEDNPHNDYPEEESSDEEEKSEKSGSESEEKEYETESDVCLKSDDSACFDRAEDPLYGDEMNENYDNDSYHSYSDDGVDAEDWRWAYR